MSLLLLQRDVKKVMENLNILSNEELDLIMNSDEKCEEIIANIEESCLKSIEAEKEDLHARNSSMAEFNLSKEPLIIENRERLAELYREIEVLTKNVEEKTTELKNKGGNITIETALALLQTAASEMEEESDALAKQYLDSEIELETFLEQFSDKRKLMHTRLVKADKLTKLIQRGGDNGLSNYMNAPPLNINSGYFPGVNIPTSPSSVPYPIVPVNMPMPPSSSYFQGHY